MAHRGSQNSLPRYFLGFEACTFLTFGWVPGLCFQPTSPPHDPEKESEMCLPVLGPWPKNGSRGVKTGSYYVGKLARHLRQVAWMLVLATPSESTLCGYEMPAATWYMSGYFSRAAKSNMLFLLASCPCKDILPGSHAFQSMH